MPVQAAQLIAKVGTEGVETTERQLESVGRKSDETRGHFDMLKGALSFAGGQLLFQGASDAFGFLKDQLGAVFKESSDAAGELAQTNQVLKSTHDVSGMTTQSILDMAGSLSHLTKFTDDQVQVGENMLLTFCLEEKAEALARGRGWISHHDLKAGDEILAYDPEDGSIRWEPVESVHRFAVNGELTRWQSKQMDVATTPHHRWWTTGRTLDRSSELPVSRRQAYQFRTTAEISGHQFAVMIGGGTPACFATTPTLDDDLVEMLAWVVTEGWFITQTPGHTGVGFCQSQTANPAKVMRIRALVERFNARGDRISETSRKQPYNDSTVSQWHFARRLGKLVHDLLPGKRLTVKLIESLTEQQARLFLEVLLLADGHTGRNGDQQFIQKDASQLDIVALLCSMLGIRTTVLERGGDRDSIYLCKTNHAWGHQLNAHEEHYEGIVWCPHLRTGIFLARCNGRTFWTGNTNIGKNVFPQATQTMLDMSQALGQDVTSSAIQLGKALGEPLTGMTALQRVGVTFDETQKKLIKTYMEHNQVAKAQGVILQELQKEFGGSAVAAGKTAAGAWAIFNQRLDDVRQTIGDALMPILTNLMSFVETTAIPVLGRFGDWFVKTAVPAIQPFVTMFEQAGSALLQVMAPVQQVQTAFSNLNQTVDASIYFAKPITDAWDRGSVSVKNLGTAIGPVTDAYDRHNKTLDTVKNSHKVYTDALDRGSISITNYATEHAKAPATVNPFAAAIKAMLPDVTKFSDWVIKTAVPNLQHLGDWFVKTGIPVIKELADSVLKNLLPPLGDLITNTINLGIHFTEWLQDSGLLQDAISTVSDILGTLVGWVADFVGWLDSGNPAVQILAGALLAVGLAIAGIKVADMALQFANFASDIKGNLAKELDKLTTEHFPHLNKAMKDSAKDAQGASKDMETALDGVKGRAEETATAETAVGTTAKTTMAKDVEEGSLAAEGSLGKVGAEAGVVETDVDIASKGMATSLLGMLPIIGTVFLGFTQLRDVIGSIKLPGGLTVDQGAGALSQGTGFTPFPFAPHAAGILDNPVGHMALLGEGGEPEVVTGPTTGFLPKGASVIPFSQLRGGGDVHVHVTVSPELSIDGYTLARQQAPYLVHVLRGSLGTVGM